MVLHGDWTFHGIVHKMREVQPPFQGSLLHVFSVEQELSRKFSRAHRHTRRHFGMRWRHSPQGLSKQYFREMLNRNFQLLSSVVETIVTKIFDFFLYDKIFDFYPYDFVAIFSIWKHEFNISLKYYLLKQVAGVHTQMLTCATVRSYPCQAILGELWRTRDVPLCYNST